MHVQEMTNLFKHQYYPEYKLKEECAVFFALDNGNILTALIHFEGDEMGTFENASLMP